MKLRPYPEYKDSGVPWLGKIPKHWECSPLRRVAQVQLSNVDKHTVDGEIPVRLCNYTDVYYRRFITPSIEFMKASALPREVKKFELRRGDVLITKDSESWMDIAVPAYVTTDLPGVLCGYHLAQIRPYLEMLRGEYLLRAFQTEPIAYQFRVAANGVTRFALSGTDIAAGLFPIPPKAEQDIITAFLAQVDYCINRFIHAKRRLIELLNEQKQAIIHRAVTRGLDPNVHLKPSGLDWLGDVPAHWEIRRNLRIFRERNERGRDDLPILIVSLHSGVTVGSEIDEASRPRRLIEDMTAYKLASEGDIAYNMMRMWQGAVGVVPTDGLISPAYVVARPLYGMNSKYFTLLFRTEAYKNEINRNSRGIVSDRNRLYWDEFKELASPTPPSAEQESIVKHIEAESARIDFAIDRARCEIDLLREYRTRLITDVVTGKLDVRGVELSALDEVDALEEWETGEDTRADAMDEMESVDA